MTKQLEAPFYFSGVIDYNGECQQVSDGEAQFWTVYERDSDGLSSAICDCYHRDDAVATTERFNALIAALELAQQQDKVALETIANLTELWNEGRNRIAELESSHKKLREAMAAIHNTIRLDGANTSLAVILSAAKRAHEESATIAPLQASPLAVKLPPRKTAADYVDDVFTNKDLAAIYNVARLECGVRIKNAGGTVSEGE